MDKITLKGMRFYSYAGLLPLEKKIGQLVEVDLTCYLDLIPAGESGAIKDTIDYRKAFDLVKHRIEEGHEQLMEALAQRIAEDVLGLPGMEKVVVTCRKPRVPLPGILDYAEVEIERERQK